MVVSSAAFLFRIFPPIVLLWIIRLAWFGALAEQAGINQIESTFMYAPILYTVSAGLILPSFKEFVFCCTATFLVKPVLLVLAGNDGCPTGIPAPCPGRDFQSVLVQNICLICTGIGVFYHLHSDARRDWLLLFETFGPLNDTVPAPAPLFPAAATRRISMGDGAPATEQSASISPDASPDSDGDEHASQVQPIGRPATAVFKQLFK